ncbi:MAG: homoserine dehydrogenase [Lentisphaerae bacterium]|nr:homoserine dehydrogenase [Lentisphaerota bacterium]
MAQTVKVGIIGFGTVGAGAAVNLLKNHDVILERTNVDVKLVRIADKDITSDRGVQVPAELLTTSVDELIAESDVVVELIGGTTIAGDFILKALNAGKSVVTANKALLATRGNELFAAAEKNSCDLYYEASVAGGIPVIKALREGLVSNRIIRMYGIMNGTCNYILTRMEAEGAAFEPVLKDAQALGYAEANPSLDVDGFDTAHKAAILAGLAYGKWFGLEAVSVEGISNITQLDMKMAGKLGYRFKLLAVIKNIDGAVQISVAPTLIPANSMLGAISGVFNGVMIEGDTVGQTLFYGRGAGRDATASAVVADVTDVALNIANKSVRRVPAFRAGAEDVQLVKPEELFSRFYLRLAVKEQPGVVAAVTDILAKNQISISSLMQPENEAHDGQIPLLIVTHATKEVAMKAAMEEIARLDYVDSKVNMFRIEDI